MRWRGFSLVAVILILVSIAGVRINPDPTASDAEIGMRSDPLQAAITFPSGLILLAAVADTDIERAQGLSYRPFPQAMLFVFDEPTQPSFWMKDMNFSIDIIWMRGSQVVGIVENAEPEHPATTLYASNEPIDMALEVPSGTVKETGLHVGDALDITFKRQ